jgi:hypothetical protein
LQLPNNEIGISDILNYRQCPQQFAFGMRRHVELPERFALYPGERDEPPEHEGYASAYGHCVHDAVQMIEETGCADEFAIQETWKKHNHFLEPDDLERLKTDIATYHGRRVTGFRLIGAELELRVPLFVHRGVQIYFRCRIDTLYQHLQNPGYFYSRDYKSSRFPKSEEEVHKDIQQWSYNMAVHEVYPECQTLVQVYDQFRYGAIPTRKTAAQRQTIKEWLILQVTAILEDDTLAPKRNDMCHWCPIMMDCRETHRSADYWINRLGALAPTKKEGRKLVMQLQPEVFGYETYTEMLPKVKDAMKVMERFVKTVEGDLKEMDEPTRAEHGYELGKPRRVDVWDAAAKRELYAELGDDFFQVVSFSKTEVEAFFGKGSREAEAIFARAEKKEHAPSLKRRAA